MRYLVLFLAFWSTSTFATDSHCSNSEKVVFSCRLSKSPKLVSVCASPTLAKSDGTLAYRFGVPGKPEFVFPSQGGRSPEQFRLAHYSRYQTERIELSFDNEKFSYIVFDYYEGGQKPPVTQGVRVMPRDGKGREIELRCAGKATSSLQTLAGIVPCDAENALAVCN